MSAPYNDTPHMTCGFCGRVIEIGEKFWDFPNAEICCDCVDTAPVQELFEFLGIGEVKTMEWWRKV